MRSKYRKIIFLVCLIVILIVSIPLYFMKKNADAANWIKNNDVTVRYQTHEWIQKIPGRLQNRLEDMFGRKVVSIKYSGKISQENIEYLSNFTDLKEMEIRTDASDFSSLNGLSDLGALKIKAPKIEGLNFDNFEHLSELDIWTDSFDVSQLQHLHLTHLTLSLKSISNFDSITKIKTLQKLDLRESFFKDVKPLLQLKQLRHLYVNPDICQGEFEEKLLDALPNTLVENRYKDW